MGISVSDQTEPLKMCISVVNQPKATKDVYQCMLLINKKPKKRCISAADQLGAAKDVYQCCSSTRSH